STSGRRARSRTPSAGFMSWPRLAAMTGASSASRARSPLRSTWRRTPTSATASSPASPPGCATSTGWWAGCSRPISSSSRAGPAQPPDFDRTAGAAREMETLPLYIDETGGLTIAQLAARARRLKRQKGLDLLVIDYIQLLQGSSRRAAESRVQEVTEITTSLKALAKELNLPILALSQLSRQVENREDKRPQHSDLRESGSIEQDADVVMFVFREEYYLGMKEPRPGSPEHEKWLLDMSAAHGQAEVIIGK